jgi:hypothetical protein
MALTTGNILGSSRTDQIEAPVLSCARLLLGSESGAAVSRGLVLANNRTEIGYYGVRSFLNDEYTRARTWRLTMPPACCAPLCTWRFSHWND